MNAIAKIALGLSLALTLVACNRGGGGAAVTDEDMTLGNANAPVTVIEYASASCSHCASFNNDVFPEFKRRFIDTGRVRYVFREFLTPPESMAAASFLLARCAGRERYFNILDAVFHSQMEMLTGGDVRGGLLRIAQGAGMTEAQFTACVTNEENMRALQQRVERYQRQENIRSTPTFVIGTQRFEGEQTIEQLAAAVAAAEGRPAPAASNSATNAASATTAEAAASNAAETPAANAAPASAANAATNGAP